MASRVMHLAIAAEIMKQEPIKDINRFRLGVILPDAYNRNVQTVNNSHLKYTTADGAKKDIQIKLVQKDLRRSVKNR